MQATIGLIHLMFQKKNHYLELDTLLKVLNFRGN